MEDNKKKTDNKKAPLNDEELLKKYENGAADLDKELNQIVEEAKKKKEKKS